MSSKYSAQDKKEALDALADCDNHYAQVAEKTGIPASTLREWVVRHHEQRIERLQTKIKHLHELLADNSLHLVKAIDDAIDGASLSQLSGALSVRQSQKKSLPKGTTLLGLLELFQDAISKLDEFKSWKSLNSMFCGRDTQCVPLRLIIYPIEPSS